jgi:AraC-like DNA-binding protein
LDLSYSLGVIVIFECLLIAFFLFTYKGQRRLSNRLLGAFFMAVAFTVSDGLLFITEGAFRFPDLAFWGNAFSFLLAPLLYAYTCSLVYPDFRLKRKDAWHLLPFLFVMGMLLFSYHLQPLEVKRSILLQRKTARYIPAGVYVVFALNYLQIVGYILLSFQKIRQYRLSLKEQFSSLKERDLSWLLYMLYIFSGTILISFINSLAELDQMKRWYPVTLVIVIVVLLLFLITVLSKALRQPSLFTGLDLGDAVPSLPEADNKQTGALLPQKKYAGSSLTEVLRQQSFTQLTRVMEMQKPFLDPELSLSGLAAILELPPRVLSQVINESTGKSFFEYVNGYRIQEAQRLLAGPDKKITVLEVLYEVGFNSKSSFNTAFKKITGLTPSDYKREKQGF